MDDALYWYGVFWAVLSCAAVAIGGSVFLIEWYLRDHKLRMAFVKWYAEQYKK
jgi:hypothetical protein